MQRPAAQGVKAQGVKKVQEGAQPRWLDEREQRAWRSLQMMQARLNAALGSQLAAESDLSLADYMVLVVLTERSQGAARLFELAIDLGWERSRVSHQIARMAARGLVRKERCLSDRRGSIVVVTDAGRSAIESAAPGHVRAVRQLFIEPLSGEQLDAIAEVARRVVGAVERAECTHGRGDGGGAVTAAGAPDATGTSRRG
jgi:DNA-binding MarR family transcriptional regulator